MLRAIFSRSSKQGDSGSRKIASDGGTSRKGKQKSDANQDVEENKANAMARTEVREAKFNFPSGRMSMVDRLDSHQKGSLFKYAVISTEPPKNRGFIMDRLRTYKPPNDHLNVRLDDLPPLLLKDEYTEVNLSQALPDKKLGPRRPFCLIADIFIHYVPMDTFMSTQSTVEIMLTDGRKLEENVVRHASISSNTGYNVLFTLDYCVETADLPEMRLSISRHVSQFKKGKSWAMCKVLIGLDFYDIAKRSNIQESLAVTQFAETDLMEFMTDPRGADSVITGEALRQMRLAYASGDIENLTVPSDDQKKLSTAATIIGGGNSLGDVEAGEVISAMKLKALAVERERANSREAAEAGALAVRPSKPLKSAMKRKSEPVVAIAPESQASNETEEVDRGEFNNLKDVAVGESGSQDGSDDDGNSLFEHEPPFVSKLRFAQ